MKTLFVFMGYILLESYFLMHAENLTDIFLSIKLKNVFPIIFIIFGKGDSQ